MEDMMTIKSTAGIADNIAALQTASRSYFREAVSVRSVPSRITGIPCLRAYAVVYALPPVGRIQYATQTAL